MARNRFILAAGGALAVIVAVGVYIVVRDAQVRTVPVVVAARVIPARTQITKTELTVVQMPPLDVPADATGNVVGQWTIHTILAGQPIQRAAIVNSGALTYGLAAGDRAFSVPVTTTTAAGGQIAPGTAVDVIVVTGSSGAGNNAGGTTPTPSAQTLIQNVTILAVEQPSGSPQMTTNSQTSSGSFASPSSSQTTSGSSTSHYVVALGVTSAQAQLLAFALGEGDSLYLAVRPPHANNIPLAPTTVLPPVPQAGPVIR